MKNPAHRKGLWLLLLSILILSSIAAGIHPALAYAPKQGDTFAYSETATVNNGQGSYSGYSDKTLTTGTEKIQSVIGNSVLADYSYGYNFSSNQGNSSSGSKSGDFTWSASTFTYVNGTDNQVGYSEPIYVWFAMDPSLPVGGTFWALNTHLAILSRNFSLELPTEGRYVQTIEAEGNGQYQRNDAYGDFTATYTWYEYFDPSTGYIVGYNYTEQDSGSYLGQAGSFTYNDVLYVTATSYPLTAVSVLANTTTAASVASLSTPDLGVLVLVAAVVLVGGAVALAVRGRRRHPLPEHPTSTPPPPAVAPSPSEGALVDLGSRPTEQVVVREVAKVNCRYCGTLIPTTVDRCPYCGGPRE